MKKFMTLLFVSCLFIACSDDKLIEQSGDNSVEATFDLSISDNSNLGLYRGIFSTMNSSTRGTIDLMIKEGANSRASLTLLDGTELKFHSTAVITAQTLVENALFVADGASFKFSVNRDGSNPMFSEVTFGGEDAALKAAKETSRLAVTAQSGSWLCDVGCVGGPGGTWSVLFVTGDGTGDYVADITTMIMIGGADVGTATGNTQDTCIDGGEVSSCDIDGVSLGGIYTWTGTHSYTSIAANCSETSGTWTGTDGRSGTFTSDVTCFTQGNFSFDPIPFTPNAEFTGCATEDNTFVFGNWTDSTVAGSCGGSTADVWYSFTANATGLTIFTTFGSTLTTPFWTVYDDTLIEVDCNVGNSFGAISITGLVVGRDYFLQISGSVDVGYCIEDFDVPTGPPANDLCADAEPIGCGDTVTGNTSAATDSDASRGPDVWYSFDGSTEAAGAIITVSLCASSYDTWLGVYEDCTLAVLTASNDDNNPECGSFGPSHLSFVNDGVTNYQIRVDGFNASSFGAYELTISCDAPTPPPANDLCADAIVIGCGGVDSGDTTFATDSTGATGNDVFYSFTGTGSPENVTVSLCGSAFDTRVRILDACGGTEIAMNDDSCGAQSEVTFASDGTSTYIIVVEAFSTGSGAYDIAVACVAAFGEGTITNIENAPANKLTVDEQYAILKAENK